MKIFKVEPITKSDLKHVACIRIADWLKRPVMRTSMLKKFSKSLINREALTSFACIARENLSPFKVKENFQTEVVAPTELP